MRPFPNELPPTSIVGYNQKDARNNLNWYAPQFLTVGANTININDIKLNDGGIQTVGWGDTMQIVGPLGSPEAIYCFWDPSADPTQQATDYYWGDGDGYAVSVSFNIGDGVGIDNAGELTYTINNAGEVPAEDVSFAARNNLNWTGNPFPAEIDINAVRLDDGGIQTVGWGDTMQIVGPLGSPDAIYCFWDPSADPTQQATDYYWGDGDGYAVSVKLAPGAGFAIDNAGELTYDIKIACPYKQ